MNDNNIAITGYTSQSKSCNAIKYNYYSIGIGNKTIYYKYGNEIIAVKDSKEPRLFLIKSWADTGVTKYGSRALGTKKQILQQIEEGKIVLVENFNLKKILEECW